MKSFWIAVLVPALAVIGVLAAPAVAVADDSLWAKLGPLQEVPVCSATGSGTFKATISDDKTAVDYELTYVLEGMVTQGHIHVGQIFTTGGISVWLCQTAAQVDPTGLAPDCPPSGTVTGTFTKANIAGPMGQGIAGSPGGASDAEFAELLRLLRHGLTYANVHSSICPGGEVRGQIWKK
jgi:CHRD domain